MPERAVHDPRVRDSAIWHQGIAQATIRVTLKPQYETVCSFVKTRLCAATRTRAAANVATGDELAAAGVY